jgi:DNA methylase
MTELRPGNRFLRDALRGYSRSSGRKPILFSGGRVNVAISISNQHDEAPTSKHQAPEKRQIANTKPGHLASATVLDPFCGTATTMVAALKHGRNSIGVELDTDYCKLAASRLMNENTLFGNAQLQIELKAHHSAPSTLNHQLSTSTMQETSPPYKTRARKKTSRGRSSWVRHKHHA